ncbi:phage tail terminator protein [Actinobacillus pleuropneumoniae]|uniref:phage tail terminator protein n=1 Tax=Actinobacillus pleuropneumoniae TaxID=715 RepID=UPI003D017FA2
MFNSTAPFDLKLVIEKLKPLMPTYIHHVGSTAEYRSISNLSQTGLPTPAVYVVPNSEIAHQSDIAVRQMVTVSFSVIVIVQSYQYSSDNPQLALSHPVIGKIREQLMGWTPPISGAKQTFFVRGDVLDYSNSYLAWMETYQTKMLIGKSR